MRNPLFLTLSLALFSASTPTVAGITVAGWRIKNPFAELVGTADVATIDSTSADRKVAMEAQGYTLVSTTTNDGLTIDLWSPQDADSKKRSILLPESLPGALAKRDSSPAQLQNIPLKRTYPPTKRSPSPISSPESDLSKRDTIDIQGRHCSTACGWQNWTKADTGDCISAYRKLYSTTGIFTLTTGQALSATSDGGKCSIWTVNHSPSTITYDYWDAAGTGQWLNGACLIQQAATVGVCTYEGIGTNVTNGVYTAVCYPSFMTGNANPS